MFYQDRKIDAQFDETMKRYWREASIEGMTDEKIANYLISHNVKGVTKNVSSVNQQFQNNKRKKAKTGEKKSRPRKELNTHVEGLKDYSK